MLAADVYLSRKNANDQHSTLKEQKLLTDTRNRGTDTVLAGLRKDNLCRYINNLFQLAEIPDSPAKLYAQEKSRFQERAPLPLLPSFQSKDQMLPEVRLGLSPVPITVRQ